MTYPVGSRVRLHNGPDTAVVVAAFTRCPSTPDCTHAAYRVRRDHGSFPHWPTDFGLWHAQDTIAITTDQTNEREKDMTKTATGWFDEYEEAQRAGEEMATFINTSLARRRQRNRRLEHELNRAFNPHRANDAEEAQ